MTDEELEEYKENLSLYIDSAQYEYRQLHPNCFYCECIKQGDWSWDYNCQIKSIFNEKEYPIFVGKNDDFDLNGKTVPFFAKIIKITEDMSPEGVLEIGNQVAFMEKEYMGNCHGFLFGTVERITDSFVFINNGDIVVRKAPTKIQKLS